MGSTRLVPLGADRQQSGRLDHHEDLPVFMEDGHPPRLMLPARLFAAVLLFH